MTNDKDRVAIGDAVIENVDLDEEEVFVADPDGQPVRYTEADAEADAAEAERAFARHLVPGGKSLSGGAVHSPRLQVVVADDTKLELERRAKASNMSLSKFLRKMVDDYLAGHPA